MNQERIAEELRRLTEGERYQGSLTRYAVQSIEESRSNYPAVNLLTYCNDMGIAFTMEDLATEEHYHPVSLKDLHDTLNMLMKRYRIDYQTILRKSGAHYTPPNAKTAPLSIRTLLAVCDVIHCEISFAKK